MDAVTYPNVKVYDFISAKVVPLRVQADSKPLSDEFQIKWTPTLVSLDFHGQEHHRTVGFLPPEELIPSLLLGMGKTDSDTGAFKEAIRHMESLLEGYARSAAAPEAVYLLGVCRYKDTHDAKPLKEAYERLKADYPGSEWVHRAQPYSLL